MDDLPLAPYLDEPTVELGPWFAQEEGLYTRKEVEDLMYRAYGEDKRVLEELFNSFPHSRQR